MIRHRDQKQIFELQLYPKNIEGTIVTRRIKRSFKNVKQTQSITIVQTNIKILTKLIQLVDFYYRQFNYRDRLTTNSFLPFAIEHLDS